MRRVLITGATGNVGLEVIKSLNDIESPIRITAGVRELNYDTQKLAGYHVEIVKFDFDDARTFKPALKDCDILFLLRPPQISNVEYFKPLIRAAMDTGIKHIVFLSVQGVEKSNMIPHHKIEDLIRASKIHFTFLRPAYFMQNFTTSLRKELIEKKRIFLPAGNAEFTLIDVRDIGKVAAYVITNNKSHINQSYELTSHDRLTFEEMGIKLMRVLDTPIYYESPGLLNFIINKIKEKTPINLILVMIMLHYLPRFQKVPAITNWVEKITGDAPISFEQFIEDHKISLKFFVKQEDVPEHELAQHQMNS